MRFYFFKCVACDFPISVRRSTYCNHCISTLRPPEQETTFTPFSSVFSKYLMLGSSRRVLTSWKFLGRSHLHHVLLERCERESRYFNSSSFDAITHVPTQHGKSWDRIGNPAERIARTLSRRYQIPHIQIFSDPMPGVSQAGLSRNARIEKSIQVSTHRCFSYLRRSRICLVDDFLTTGSTLRAYGEGLQSELDTSFLGAYVLGLRPPIKREGKDSLLIQSIE